MKAGIAGHVRAAVAEADAIIFCTDATTGAEMRPTPRAAIQLLRESNKPVFYSRQQGRLAPRRPRGVRALPARCSTAFYPVSALHGRGIGELEAALVEALPEGATEEVDEEGAPPRIALVGRPNAGKSSLLNKILGEDRVLVDARPGTTRDAIDALVERGEGKYVFIDTAGIRKKSKVSKEASAVESMSVLSSIRSIERAHVVVLLCDAAEGVAEQDAKILGLAEERGRAMIVVLSKSDLLGKDALVKAEELAREKLSFVPYVPIVRLSSKAGRGLGDLFRTIDQVRASSRKRVTTGELNRFFASVLDTHPPPTMGARAPRLYYVTQAEVAPPTFVAMTNAPDNIHFSYRRYVVNQLRKHFGFEGVPVIVHYKARRRRELKDMRGGQPAGGPPPKRRSRSE